MHDQGGIPFFCRGSSCGCGWVGLIIMNDDDDAGVLVTVESSNICR